jgi:hypothetical protein
MRVIKDIDYTDGGQQYNRMELKELKEYGVAEISQVETETIDGEEIETVIKKEPIWFDLDENPFGITEADIELFNTPEEE